MTTTLHVVAAGSLRSWFRFFVDDPGGADRIFHAGDDPGLSAETVLARVRAVHADDVVLHSSHETLLRDAALAAKLRVAGFPTLAQSPGAARLGVDKFLMRDMLADRALSGLPWWRGDAAPPSGPGDPLVVVKARSGTQSEGVRLARSSAAGLTSEEFCELYSDGIEYSVLVHRDAAGDAVMPPVWKGPTSTELVPPWRRLRLCPDPFGGPELGERLREVGLRTAVEAEVQGWTEVELLVTGSGAVHVLEINPRVSGTMRIAALATRTALFSLHRRPDRRGPILAVRPAAEVPYDGPPISDPGNAIFGTSRLTVAGDTYAQVAEALVSIADDSARGMLPELPAGDLVATGTVQ